jgi:hypothetical protein
MEGMVGIIEVDSVKYLITTVESPDVVQGPPELIYAIALAIKDGGIVSDGCLFAVPLVELDLDSEVER